MDGVIALVTGFPVSANVVTDMLRGAAGNARFTGTGETAIAWLVVGSHSGTSSQSASTKLPGRVARSVESTVLPAVSA